MPRRKIAMRFIDNTRARAATFASRTKGLRKKAEELATLCSVPVALVCCAAGGGGGAAPPPLVWESREGVLDRYRALPPEIRAQHTHRGYLETDLRKERAKHARVRQHGLGALADKDAALLNGMTLDEARELLEAVDAALLATSQRMEALGLPTTANDDGGYGGGQELEQFAFPDGPDVMMPGVGSNNPLVDMDAGFQLQMMPAGHGNYEFAAGQLEQQFSWDDRMQRNAEMMAQPAYGFQCTDANYLGGAAIDGGYGQMQPPVYGNADHYGCWTDLTMRNTTDESCNAALPLPPVGCYPSLGSGGGGGDYIGGSTAVVPQHSALVVTGGDYINAQPLGYAMGMGANFASQQDNYATHHWSAEEFQRADTGSTSLQAATSTWTRSSDQAFNYLQ